VEGWRGALKRLEVLQGQLVHAQDGPVIIRARAVVKPDILLDAVTLGRAPSRKELASSLDRTLVMVRMSAALLAGARRDLLLLEQAATISRRGMPDAAWIEQQRARIVSLSSSRLSTAVTWQAPHGRLPSWFGTGLLLVAELHGKRAAQVLSHTANQFDPALARPLLRWSLKFPPGDVLVSESELQFAALHPEVLPLSPAAPVGLGTALSVAALAKDAALAGRMLGWIDGGLPLERLQAAAEFEDVSTLGGVEGATVAAWCTWVTTLAPHFAAMGVRFHVPMRAVAAVRGARDGSLAILLHCLTNPNPARADVALQMVGTPLALFKSAAAEARALLRNLHGPSSLAAVKKHRHFAAWLGRDALLGLFIHLKALAGETPNLPQSILEDFNRAEEVRIQLKSLQALPNPSEEQQREILNLMLEESSGDVPGPGPTRRQLEEQLPELTWKAWMFQQDALLRRHIRQIWKVKINDVTPAWMDAVQVQAFAGRSRPVLARLVRWAAAHPGQPVAHAFKPNQRWLKDAYGKFTLDVWLKPETTALMVEGTTYVIGVEQDPLEALKLAIPFHTCLALDSGVTTVAAVLNAADVNKHVIFVRDETGAIVASRAIGIGLDWGLVVAEVKCAIPGSAGAVLRGEVDAFCADFAARCGLVESRGKVPVLNAP